MINQFFLKTASLVLSRTVKPGIPCSTKQSGKRQCPTVLVEILQGHTSDPPGFSFYSTKLTRQGQPAVDELGIPLLTCSRGTNDTEYIHKKLVSIFGT